MAVDSNLLVVGGFQGEIICKVLLLHKYSSTLQSWYFALVTNGMTYDILLGF